MGFGAIILSGDDNRLLSEDLTDSLTEVRVEQFLDRPTRFAMRFQEDYNDDGEPRMVEATELSPEQMITVAVEDGDGLKCLVRGPITVLKSSFALGGPGSWFEVHGMDRRVEMSRVCQRRAWVGMASGAAQSILSSYGFATNIQQTTRLYSEQNSTLNQRATDLDFLNQITRQNNLCFWISYACRTSPFNPLGGSIEVEETANLTSSPPRPDNAVSITVRPLPVPLVPSTDMKLRVNPPPEEDQTVNSFELSVQVERPTSFDGQAVDDRTARLDRTSAEDIQPPIVTGGQSLRDIAPTERLLCVTTAGDQTELQNRSQAALTEAGWMLHATARTTAHMLGGVLVPHDVVEVENLGARHSGPYQVDSVTHTINAADHHMEIHLRRNAIGSTNGTGLPLP
ncbi:MAG: hypothetical protein QNJ82_02485 [Gammaproteobacteria bacterium]|nr:hypothetical protein [Gammaproteobacteria bacterium]